MNEERSDERLRELKKKKKHFSLHVAYAGGAPRRRDNEQLF